MQALRSKPRPYKFTVRISEQKEEYDYHQSGHCLLRRRWRGSWGEIPLEFEIPGKSVSSPVNIVSVSCCGSRVWVPPSRPGSRRKKVGEEVGNPFKSRLDDVLLY